MAAAETIELYGIYRTAAGLDAQPLEFWQELYKEHRDDPVEEELTTFISSLSYDEQVDLVTLVWLGRDDNDASDWAFSIFEFIGWINVTPMSGDVIVGSRADLEVSFDATGLVEGDYYADIVITNNAGAPVVVPVALNVSATGFRDVTRLASGDPEKALEKLDLLPPDPGDEVLERAMKLRAEALFDLGQGGVEEGPGVDVGVQVVGGHDGLGGRDVAASGQDPVPRPAGRPAPAGRTGRRPSRSAPGSPAPLRGWGSPPAA